MAIIQDGDGGAGKQAVGAASKAGFVEIRDADGNALVPASPSTQVPSSMSGLLGGVLDEGGFVIPVRGGRAGSTGIATGQILFLEECEGATLHLGRWIGAITTMTVAQTATGINLNGNASAATGAVAVLNSSRRFERRMNQILDLSFRARVNAVANSVVEMGFGDTTSGVAAIVNNAALFRHDGPSMTPVFSFNGSEFTGSPIDMSAYTTQYLDYGILVEDTQVTFTIKRSDTGAMITRQTLRLPLSQSKAWSTSRIPLMFRCYNKGVAPSQAPVALLGAVTLLRLDDATATPMSHQMAGLGLGSEANPLTYAQTTQWANSAQPASAALSNTAASYGTLGGKWQFPAPAAAETDYALFGYLVPAPASLVVTGCRISSMNTGANVATTATVLEWALGVGSTAVSLATATSSPSAVAPARIPLGVQGFRVGDPTGFTPPDIDVSFEAPLLVPSGRYLHVILRAPAGTATASEIFRGTVQIRGYFV